MKLVPTSVLLKGLMHAVALSFRYRPSLRRRLYSDQGPIEFSVGFRTEDGSLDAGIVFRGGSVRACGSTPPGADVVLVFADEDVVREMLRASPHEVMHLLLKNRMRTEGSLTCLNLFNFYIALALGKRAQGKPKAARPSPAGTAPRPRRSERLLGARRDPGVKFLEDPYLSRYRLADFPRLEAFLDVHFTQKPEISTERALLVTRWHKANGFETRSDGTPWQPALRQGHVLRYLLEHRAPLIRRDDLIAGTTTDKDIGVVLYPDAHGTLIWGELTSVSERELNPYDISPAAVELLHREVFPYWLKRNFREWVRARHQEPRCQTLDERFAVYFLWKTAALSHTIPDFPKVLARGTRALAAEARAELARDGAADEEKRATLEGMALGLEGVELYARRLAEQAAREAAAEGDATRRAELSRLAEICARVPAAPARTLDEAVNALWITWVALHMESTNAGLSLGRLDVWLQPYFEADLAERKTPEERERYVRHAIELVGCLYMRCTDHLPLIPDLGNYLFGGSSSDQAITLGGVTADGADAVCDMTYVFLKVTELLGIRDPNVNARFHPGVNSETYLKRLCEVNLITQATPSLHNDHAVLASIEGLGYPPEQRRDWAATGCVEPTLCGKHMGHTNSMMMNLVAALEMALNDGRHPLMRWDVGPRTGRIEDGAFPTFEDFFEAFERQLAFLVAEAVEYNNLLGEAHAELRPTPLLSSTIEGCVAKGRDVTRGGALHNSSGAACIGLADVTDSLLAIEKLVYEERRLSFAELKRAVDSDFASSPGLQAMIRSRVRLFGSGDEHAVAMANRVARMVNGLYAAHRNYRGGPYTSGFWSMSNHVAFGTLTGALPSGRNASKPFTPGLTPQAFASKSLLDNLRDVAALDPKAMNNNMAFNVKVVPAASDTHAQSVDQMSAYASAYFELGGMQMQMNLVSSATLRDAMEHPEAYRDLLIRISGYNAYFTTLNRDLQLELIERAEYRG